MSRQNPILDALSKKIMSYRGEPEKLKEPSPEYSMPVLPLNPDVVPPKNEQEPFKAPDPGKDYFLNPIDPERFRRNLERDQRQRDKAV